VRIDGHKVVLDGSVSANGALVGYGAGAGGSVWISADEILGAGAITANGGAGAYPGGGGRIAVYAESISAGLRSSVSAKGYGGGTVNLWSGSSDHELRIEAGTGGETRLASSLNDGLLRVSLGSGSKTSFTGSSHLLELRWLGPADVWHYGKLTAERMLQNGGTFETSDSCLIDSVILAGTSTWTHRSCTIDTIHSLNLRAQYLEVDLNAKIDASGKGYPVGAGPNGQKGGPNQYNSGGSHGGMGAAAYIEPYGDSLAPDLPGSGGGRYSDAGSPGGGIVRIDAGEIVLNGRIAVNGASVNYGSGAGGSIWIDASEINGTGAIAASGGTGGVVGGGGRIAVYCCKIAQVVRDNIYADGYQNGSVRVPCNSGVPAPVVEILSPVRGSFYPSELTIPVVWSVNGVLQTTELSQDIKVGSNLVIRSATSPDGVMGSDTCEVVICRMLPIVDAGPDVEATGQSINYGKIVVNADEWTLSSSGFGSCPDASTFVHNIASWFTSKEHGAFLYTTNNFGMADGALANALQKLGHSLTFVNPDSLTLAPLKAADGVFVSSEIVNNDTLIAYVRGGGNVYLCGGVGIGDIDEANRWNPFLQSFGLQMGWPYAFMSFQCYPIESSSIVAAGVHSLAYWGGNPISRSATNNDRSIVIASANGQGLVGVFDGTQKIAAARLSAQSKSPCGGAAPTYSWALAEGPSSADIVNPDSGSTNVILRQTGTYRFRVTSSVYGVSDFDDVVVTFRSFNNVPKITSTPKAHGWLGIQYIYNVDATDMDGDPLTFRLTAHPAGMQIDSTTGMISWLPDSSGVGLDTVAVQVSDGNGGIAEQTYLLTILNSPIADLAADSNDVSLVSVNTSTLAMTGAVKICVSNRGTGDAPAGYQITLFEDLNHNGNFDRGTDHVVGNLSTASVLPAGASAKFTIPVGDTAQFMGNQLFVFVDSDNRIPESDETNNQLGSLAGCGNGLFDCIDLTASHIRQSGSICPDTTRVLARVGNGGAGAIQAGVHVSLYDITSGGHAFLGTTPTSRQLLPGQYEDVALVVAPALHGQRTLQVVADDDGTGESQVRESDKTNNTVVASISCCNNAPLMTPVPDASIFQGHQFSCKVNAVDADGDALTFALDTMPDRMSINPQSGLISWTPTSSQQGTHRVVVAATDGNGGIARQGFAITVIASLNTPPHITSTPPPTATVGVAYQYQVVVNDPDKLDSQHYSLFQAPAGLSVSTSGLVTWPDAATRPSSAQVTLVVTDDSGATDQQSWTITMAADTQPPVVTVTATPNPVKPGETSIIRVSAVDNVGVAKVRLFIDSNEVALDGGGAYSFTSNIEETVQLRAQAIDVNGNQASSTIALTVTRQADNTPPGVTLTYSPTNPAVGQIVTFTVSTTDNVGVDPDMVWLLIYGKYVPVINGTAHWTALKRGSFPALATAYDLSGNYGAASATVPVTMSGSDSTAPTCSFADGYQDTVILGRMELRGSAEDANFAYYTLKYREAGTQNDWVEISRGTSPVHDGVLGIVDGTNMENGDYTIRLDVYDAYGNGSAMQTQVRVDGQQKIGQFSLAFEDMSFDLPGVSLIAVRAYDSRVKSIGDFGYGWRLDLRSIKLSESAAAGNGWRAVENQLAYDMVDWDLVPTRKHTVTIAIPGARSQVFEARAALDSSFGGGIWGWFSISPDFGRIVFDPQPGTYSKLEIVGNDGSFEWVGGNLYEPNGEYMDPVDAQRYKLTLMDGTYYIIDQDQGGVVEMGDAHGNTVTLTSVGISHNVGKSFSFGRDTDNRITSISDGTGRTIQYTYDPHGNLQRVTDANGNVTRFKYAPDHYLLEIIDARGVRATRTEYDDAGRMVRQINPLGDTLTLAHDLDNQTETTRDFNGNETQYTYDSHGNVLTKTLPSTGGRPSVSWQYTYNDLDNLLSTRNPDGTTRSSTWDANGNELTTTDENGHTTTRTYNDRGQVLTERDALGRTTSYEYGATGDLLRTKGPDNVVTSEKTYATNGNVLTEKDALGNLTSYEYDPQGRMIARTDALGRTTRYVINDCGQTVADVDADGDSTHYAFDANGNQLMSVNALGDTTRSTYSSINKVTSQTDARGNVTRMEYDLFGQLKRTVAPDSTFTSKTVDAQGNVATTTDEVGRITRFEYDNENRVVKTTFNDGASIHVEYDALGRRLSTVDARGNRTRYKYDNVGNNTVVRDALGNETRYEYDNANRRTAMVDALGHRTEYLYDDYDRLTRTTFADGTYRATEYDAAGHKTAEVDQAGKRTEFVYDSTGNLRSVKDAMGHVTSYTYDANNNRTSQTDANGHTTTMAYDKLNRLVSRTYPNGDHEHFVFDANGNQVVKIDGAGDSTVCLFDARNRESLRRYTNSGHTVETRYTDDGRPDSVIDNRGVTTYAWDDHGRQALVTNPDGTFIESRYDCQGNRTVEKTPFDSTFYGYDVLNRMSTVTSASGDVTQYRFDAVGNRDSVVNANGTSTGYHYDNLNWLVNVTNQGPSGVISSYTYALNGAGIRTGVTEADGSAVTYGYDDLYRLTGETRIGAHAYAITYTYDNVGNRLTQVRDGVTTSYVYNNRDQLPQEDSAGVVTSYTYDHAGRMETKTNPNGTTTYGWQDNDRMVSVQGPGVFVTYSYDAEGRRVGETTTAGTTGYLIDAQLPYGQVIAETDGAGSATATYVYGLERISQRRSGNVRFYHADGQGSTRELTDALGNVTDTWRYTAFGSLLARTGTTQNTYLYVGEAFDPNCGFYYNRARWYNPESGRFSSLDPWDADPFTPSALHGYLYANASPSNYVDPSGLFSITEVVYVSAIASILASVTIPRITGLLYGEYEGKTTNFSVRFMLGVNIRLYPGIGFEGPFAGILHAIVTERPPKKPVPNFVPEQADYQITLFGLGFGGGILFSDFGADFETLRGRNASDFEGIGNMTVGLSLGVGVASLSFGGYMILPDGSVILPKNFVPDVGVGIDTGLSSSICLAYWNRITSY